MSEQYNQDDVIPHGEAIVEKFGGIRPMASKLNVPVTTVQGWKKRDAIPAIRRDEILSAAAHYDIDLKGLVAESANQNARPMGRIAEDPALAAAPMRPTPAAQPQAAAPRPATPTAQQPAAQPAAAPRRDTGANYSAADVRKTAQRTSFLTTVALVAVLAGTGFVLFGQQSSPERIENLESRIVSMEQRQTTAAAQTPDGEGLGARIADLSAIVGTSATGLADMARGVASGNAPILQRLAVIEQRLTETANLPPALSNMAGRMESMAQGAPGTAGQGEWQSAVAELRTLVMGMQGDVSNLNGALEEAKTENTALGRQLTDVSGRDLGAAAMLLALTEMRDSINRQAPFADDLALLRQVATGTDPELAASVDKLAPYAETGVLSSAGLKRELQASANDIISAKMRGEDVSVKEKVMGRLEGLFSVQKDGTPVAGSAENALIQKASAQLDAGDVAGAMATLQTLDGPAAEAAQPWATKAAATMAAQALDGQLVQAITNKIKSGLSSLKPNSSAGYTAGAGPIDMTPGAMTTLSPSGLATAPTAPTITPPPVSAVPQAPAVTIQQ